MISDTQFSIKKTVLVFLSIALFSSSFAQSAKNDKEAAKISFIKNLISSKNFAFKAESVLPMRGNIRQLTSDYDVKISKDTVRTYLPYFGRAYTAPINPSEGGIQFISTSFDYIVKESKKGGWDIIIKPKDVKEVRQLFLSISETGYASLQVSSTSREFISFNGYITEKNK